MRARHPQSRRRASASRCRSRFSLRPLWPAPVTVLAANSGRERDNVRSGVPYQWSIGRGRIAPTSPTVRRADRSGLPCEKKLFCMIQPQCHRAMPRGAPTLDRRTGGSGDMARYRWLSGRLRGSSAGRRPVRGYTLRDRRGRVTYVGITNNPRRRASQHRSSGKRGRLRVETGAMSRGTARRWEGARLSGYRSRNRGRNPRYNKTRSGGWRY